MAETSSRIFEIKCIGDSNQVADMLEDIAKDIRKGFIHDSNEFYSFESHGYVKKEFRIKTKWGA